MTRPCADSEQIRNDPDMYIVEKVVKSHVRLISFAPEGCDNYRKLAYRNVPKTTEICRKVPKR